MVHAPAEREEMSHAMCCIDKSDVACDKRRFIRVQVWGLPFSTYAPRVGGWGQASYTFPLRITCKKGEGGPDSM